MYCVYRILTTNNRQNGTAESKTKTEVFNIGQNESLRLHQCRPSSARYIRFSIGCIHGTIERHSTPKIRSREVRFRLWILVRVSSFTWNCWFTLLFQATFWKIFRRAR